MQFGFYRSTKKVNDRFDAAQRRDAAVNRRESVQPHFTVEAHAACG